MLFKSIIPILIIIKQSNIFPNGGGIGGVQPIGRYCDHCRKATESGISSTLLPSSYSFPLPFVILIMSRTLSSSSLSFPIFSFTPSSACPVLSPPLFTLLSNLPFPPFSPLFSFYDTEMISTIAICIHSGILIFLNDELKGVFFRFSPSCLFSWPLSK